MKKKLFLSLITTILLLQFLPIRPPEGKNRNEIQTSDEVKKILRKSCYDCHSDLTEWPWYSKIFPINVYLYRHVREGKVELNLSEWGSLSKKKIDKGRFHFGNSGRRGNASRRLYTFTSVRKNHPRRITNFEKLGPGFGRRIWERILKERFYKIQR